MKKNTIQKLTFAAVIAALYAVITLLLSWLSFGPIQFRIAEALTVLPYFSPVAIVGLSIGCLISNSLPVPMHGWTFYSGPRLPFWGLWGPTCSPGRKIESLFGWHHCQRYWRTRLL